MAGDTTSPSFWQRLAPSGFLGNSLQHFFQALGGEALIVIGVSVRVFQHARRIEQLQSKLDWIRFGGYGEFINKAFDSERIHGVGNGAPPRNRHSGGRVAVFDSKIRDVVRNCRGAIHL